MKSADERVRVKKEGGRYHHGNLRDALVLAAERAIAKSGGVAGLNLHGSFLRVGGAAGIADAVKMTKHMIAVAGAEHVGIGSDFDGATPPADLADASRLPALGDALRKAGLSESEVRAIFEGNVRRVLAWKPRQKADGAR